MSELKSDIMQSTLQTQMSQLLTGLSAMEFSKMEILDAAGLMVLRTEKRCNGAVIECVYRFERASLIQLKPFNPSGLMWEAKREWLKKLRKAKVTEEQIYLFLDTDERAVSRCDN